VRLKGLEKEASSLTSEVSDLRTKNDKAEKFDSTAIDRLEGSVAELGPRVETGSSTDGECTWHCGSSIGLKLLPRKRKRENYLVCSAEEVTTSMQNLRELQLQVVIECYLKRARRK
jgi:hypothetical protein